MCAWPCAGRQPCTRTAAQAASSANLCAMLCCLATSSVPAFGLLTPGVSSALFVPSLAYCLAAGLSTSLPPAPSLPVLTPCVSPFTWLQRQPLLDLQRRLHIRLCGTRHHGRCRGAGEAQARGGDGQWWHPARREKRRCWLGAAVGRAFRVQCSLFAGSANAAPHSCPWLACATNCCQKPGNFPFSFIPIAGTRSTRLLLLPSSSPRASQGTRIYFDAMWNEKCYGTSKVEDVSAGEWGSKSLPACLFVFTVDITAKKPAIQPASVPAALGAYSWQAAMPRLGVTQLALSWWWEMGGTVLTP